MSDDADDREAPISVVRRRALLAAAALVGGSVAAKFPGIVSTGDVSVANGAAGSLLQRVLQALGHGDVVAGNIERGGGIDEQLSRILRQPVAQLAATQAPSTDALKQTIRVNIEADYRDGAIRVLGGWWLSETEAGCLELIARLKEGNY